MDDVTQMGSSALLGFVFRQYAENRKERHAENMAKHEASESSMQSAASRGGTWMRRGLYFIVAFSLVSVIIAGFMGTNVVLEYQLHRKFLIFEWDKVKTIIVDGVVLLKENRSAFLNMVSFYFGQGVK